jgi:hypothetical protein
MRKSKGLLRLAHTLGGKIIGQVKQVFAVEAGLPASEGVLVGGQKVASEVGLTGSLFVYSQLEKTLVGSQV